MTDDARFDRLENKIDKLTDAVTQIARVEEKIFASSKRLDTLENRTNKLENDLDEVANIARRNSGVAAFGDKLFWLSAGGLISFISYIFRG